MRGLVIGAAVVAMAGAASAQAVKSSVPSLDGGYRYERVARWATSDDIVQVRLSDGRKREVIDGNSLAVIRNGPYRGFLLVQRHRYHPEGGSYDPTDVVRPDGKVQLEIPSSIIDDSPVSVSNWLHSNGWRAW